MAGADDQKGKVMQLRDEGERLHSSGGHQQSLETLAEAKAILGIN